MRSLLMCLRGFEPNCLITFVGTIWIVLFGNDENWNIVVRDVAPSIELAYEAVDCWKGFTILG
jgi:hypothetical protein